MGASAGGLEAFEQFFRSVAPDTGMGFVLVPHLDPSHASILSEILQRCTAMPVVEAQDQMQVQPDHVYIIPPNRDMGIFHGMLQLAAPEQPRGQRLLIDAFLRSLADDQAERAIGIILSGTGTDGTLGARAILGAGGITLVQEPSTAKFDGMPTSVIQGGYATHVLPVQHMPQTLEAATRKLAVLQLSPAARPAGLNQILALLRSATGHDFALYKKSTIARRIERRMSQHGLDDTEAYVRYLKEHPPELHRLFTELLINVTRFFRDPEAFFALKTEALPELLKNKPEDYAFRVWVAGCASGEEAYSIAMLLREYLEESGTECRVQIYATDLDDEAVACARAGVYPPNIMQDVTPARLRRFFTRDEAGLRVKKEIREMVVFAVQNVIKDPPFTRLDLLSCRNLMIYLEPELQRRLIPAFHYALKPGGVLFLSPSESIGNHPELFAAINRKWKLYRAAPSLASTRTIMASGIAWAAGAGSKTLAQTMPEVKEANLAELTRSVLLQCYAPASVVTDLKGTIRFVHGDTGKYLRPAPGQATLNLVEMAREGLQLALRHAIGSATQGAPTLEQAASLRNGSELQDVRFSVRTLSDPDAGEGLLLVSFADAPQSVNKAAPARARGKSAAGSQLPQRAEELERELAHTKENLQATIEEQQASNEELKSANEELQSTNEELETSKEELQSVNEELITVNNELQSKIEQLSGMQNDMKNLLDNINVGTIFLDRHLVIRRFTREASRVYRFAPSDMGCPLADIKSTLENEDLLHQAQDVLDTLIPVSQELRSADGAWFLARIQPYRTLDNVIDGVVLTFTDISERIAAMAERQARELAEGLVDAVHEPLLVLDGELRVVSASRAYYQSFKTSAQETVGQLFHEMGQRQWDIQELHELLQTVLPRDQRFQDFAVEREFVGAGSKRLLLSARRLAGKTGEAPLILLTMQEIPAS
ncbi:MAG: chemotaxis protein CheB [Betaproteobacteria bacterium]